MDFDQQDVWRLARHVRLNAIQFDDCGLNAYYVCGCCERRINAYRNNGSEIPHASDCLYLIAGDVLTGCPEGDEE